MTKEKKIIRYRNIEKKIRLTDEENNLLLERMEDIKITNFNVYARAMLLNGSVNIIDTSDIKEHTLALSRIGNNINQIAVRLNENNYNDYEISIIKKLLQELIDGEKEIIKACRKINNLR